MCFSKISNSLFFILSFIIAMSRLAYHNPYNSENDRLLTAQLLTLDGNSESKVKPVKALSNDK